MKQPVRLMKMMLFLIYLDTTNALEMHLINLEVKITIYHNLYIMKYLEMIFRCYVTIEHHHRLCLCDRS